MAYLVVDEQSTYIDVYCDGYVLRVYSSTSNYYLSILSPDLTLWDDARLNVYSGAVYYYLRYDASKIVEVVSASSTRVIIRAYGELTDASSNGLGLYVEALFTIYDSYFTTTFTFTCASSIVIDDFSNAYGYLRFAGAVISNRVGMAESSGSEVTDPSAAVVQAADYFGFTSDEFNLWQTILSDDNSSSFYAFNRFESPAFYWNNITLTAGTYRLSCITHIDSAEREGGKLYDGSFSPVFSDNFETGSALDSNWTEDLVGFAVSSGYAQSATTWDNSRAYYNTSLGSNDHSVEGVLNYTGNNNALSFLVCRYDPTTPTGYCVAITGPTSIYLYSFSGASRTWIGGATDQAFTAGEFYSVKLKVIGSTFQIYVDGVLVSTITDSTYSAGSYAGIWVTSSDTLYGLIDTFQCGIFSATERLEIGNQWQKLNTITYLGMEEFTTTAYNSTYGLTIPTGCDFIILGVVRYDPDDTTSTTHFDYVRINSIDGTLINCATFSGDPVVDMHYFYPSATGVGSQTLSWDFITDAAPEGNAFFYILYFRGVAQSSPVRSQDTHNDQSAAGVETTDPIATEKGDLLVLCAHIWTSSATLDLDYDGLIVLDETTVTGGHGAGIGYRLSEMNGDQTQSYYSQYGQGALVCFIPAMPGVHDLVSPQSIGDSLSTDGALHVEPATGEVEFTNDIIRHRQAVLVHDPRIYTGSVSSPTQHLVGWWKCDDNAASTEVIDVLGNADGALTGGHNTEDISTTDSIKGRCFLFDGAADYVNLSSAISNLTDPGEFTLILRFKPNFSYNEPTDQTILSIYAAYNDLLSLFYAPTYDRYRITERLGGATGTYTPFGQTYTDDNILQQWKTLILSVSVSSGLIYLKLGEEVYTGALSNDWAATPTSFRIGYGFYSGSWGAYYIDEIKLYDGCLLPFGAHFTGNGAVDTSVAHNDVLFHWDCESVNSNIPSPSLAGTASGSPEFSTVQYLVGTYSLLINAYNENYRFTVTNGDIIDKSEGSLSLWFYGSSFGSQLAKIQIDSSNYVSLYVNNSSILYLRWNYGGTEQYLYSSSAVTTSAWNYVRVTWSASKGVVSLSLNGQLISTGVFNALTGDVAYLYLGETDYNFTNAVYIDQVYITNNPDTPQIPTVSGKPVHVPLIEVA